MLLEYRRLCPAFAGSSLSTRFPGSCRSLLGTLSVTTHLWTSTPQRARAWTSISTTLRCECDKGTLKGMFSFFDSLLPSLKLRALSLKALLRKQNQHKRTG